MLRSVIGRSLLVHARCRTSQRPVQQLFADLMRTPRRGAGLNGAGAAMVTAVQEDTVVVKSARKTPTPRKGAKAKAEREAAVVTTTTVVEEMAVAVEQPAASPKPRGKRKAGGAAPDSPAKTPAKSPAKGAAKKASSRSPSKRVGVLTPEEAAAREKAATEAAAAEAAAAAAAAAPEADGASPLKKKPRHKKQVWPPGPLYEVSMRPPPLDGPATRILSWNVAGLRALMKKEPEALKTLAEAEGASILCLQETKLQEQHVEEAQASVGLDGWAHAWNCSTAVKGYSGTAIISRQPPLSVTHGLGVEDHDREGRVITAEYLDFFLTTVYTPNSGEGLRRLEYRTKRWDADFAAFVAKLRQRKPVIITGDLNCAHKEIDIHEPKRNLRSAGFTEEERQSFTERYTDAGLVDAFRAQHPGIVAYTYFSHRMGMRAKGKGWRLDYYLVSEELAPRVHDCFHLPHIMGSDHLPIGLVLRGGGGGGGTAEAGQGRSV